VQMHIKTMKLLYDCIHEPSTILTQSDMLHVLTSIATLSAWIQFIMLCLVMFVGPPGVYQEGLGLMYISSNFCTKSVLGSFFMIFTLPTWALLACSVSLVKNNRKRNMILWVISLPLPVGIGIIMFSLCDTPFFHYAYVNAFVGTIALVHIVVAATAKHFLFIQTYSFLLLTTALCGVGFVLFALIETGPGVKRNTAVVFEYISVIGFITLNSLATDRIREHICP
jgi:hypothetical protein